MSYILFLSLVRTHKNIRSIENILSLALCAGSGRRTYISSTRYRMWGRNGPWSTACQLNELHSFRLPHKIHCTGEQVAHSSQPQINCSRLLSTHSRATGRDTDLALPCMMRRRLCLPAPGAFQRSLSARGSQPVASRLHAGCVWDLHRYEWANS